ncbi:hypothetical protein [Aeoliella sp.]|uniref:hypothetical protein n=1 Tax=Aeoliella sp. TaxID=2795800 RepID=UPI003CCB7546
MSADRESPNPFESPRTVATGDAKEPPLELGPRLRDLKYQIIGFAVLAVTGAIGIAVAAGLFVFANNLSISPRWDWIDSVLRFVGVVLVAIGIPLFGLCAPWTLKCAVQFAFLWYSGRGPSREGKS